VRRISFVTTKREDMTDSLPQIQHPALRALHRLWSAHVVDGEPPLRSQIDVQHLAPWLGSLLLLDVLPGPDFRYRVYGSEVATLFGKDRTGSRVRDFATPAAELMPFDYEAALESRDAHVVARTRLVRVAKQTGARLVEQLILPLRRSGDAIEQLLVGVYALHAPPSLAAADKIAAIGV
jgi:hypothetical protein